MTVSVSLQSPSPLHSWSVSKPSLEDASCTASKVLPEEYYYLEQSFAVKDWLKLNNDLVTFLTGEFRLYDGAMFSS